MVAERLRDQPAVLGYDLMNEPHPGSRVAVYELPGMDVLVQTYPRAIAGTPLSEGFDLPAARHDPDGWTLTASDPDDAWRYACDQVTEVRSVTTDGKSSPPTLTIPPS